MKFDKKQYREEKNNVIELIKKTHDWENTEGFIADGIINPEIYENEKLKVLVLLGESYGYNECGEIEIEDQTTQDILGLKNPTTQTTKKITSLLWLLFKSLEKGEKLSWDEFPYLFEINDNNFEELQTVLLKIAWVNVKKSSKDCEEGTRQKWKEIASNAYKNYEILQKQLDSIAPELIIVCSEPVMESVNDMGLLGENIQGDKWKIQHNNKGQKIIYVSHPSYLTDWSYQGVYETFEIIYDGLMGGKSN